MTTGAASVDRAAYVRGEVAISVAINAVLSLVFFLIVFGWPAAVQVRGIGHYAFDALPQSIMIGLMSTLVPGAITRARIRARRIAGTPEAMPALLRRCLFAALGSGAIGGGVAGVLMLALPGPLLPALPAAAIKIAYGALLALVVTPIGLRRALSATDFA